MTKSEQVRSRVEAMMAEGTTRPEAFKRLSEELSQPLGTIRGAFYAKRGEGPSRPRRRETTIDAAVADARAALARAVEQIDLEVVAARVRVDQARAEHDALKATSAARKQAITERLEALK